MSNVALKWLEMIILEYAARHKSNANFGNLVYD